VDTEVEHDLTTGLPHLRGRTLKGLLVEECANLLYGLGESGAGPAVMSRLREAAGFLFGRPGSSLGTEAALHVGSAQLPKALREAVAADVEAERLDPRDVLDALTGIRRQTAIDDATGAPQEGSLRSMRVTLRELAFYAPVRFDRNPTNDALALLAACARALHRGGTARNRGRGRLCLRLYDASDDEAKARSSEKRTATAEALTENHFEHFDALVRGTADPPEKIPMTADRSSSIEATDGKTVVYRLRLEQPVIATAVEGDPNSSVSSNHLPGSALRGALIARYLRRFDQDDLAGDDRARRLFFDGNTRFLNGYPVVQGEYRGEEHATRPTPLSYYHKKGDKRTLSDFALESPSSDDETQWKRARSPFQVEMGKLHLETPERHVAVHNQRDRIKGRATEDSGELFRYDALAPAQTFEAAICCETDDDARLLKDLLEETPALQIGGARSADYGQAHVQNAKQPGGRWHECGTEPPALRDDRSVVITLLSHALVRDGQGQFTVSEEALVDTINRALGLEGEQEQLHPHRAFLRNEMTGGFNRKWNLPLPQALAVKMGSVLVLKQPSDAPGDLAERLADLETRGIGERRAEGFGRVAVNRYGGKRDDITVHDPETQDRPGPERVSTEDGSEAHEVAQRIANRLLRRRLDLALVKRAGDVARGNFGEIYENQSEPTPSQLGRLRTAFRNALRQFPNHPEDGNEHLSNFLHNLPSNARSQLERGTFTLFAERRTGNLYEWLKDRIDLSGQQALLRELSGQSQFLPKVGQEAKAELKDELAYEYSLRLAHDVVKRAANVYKQQQKV